MAITIRQTVSGAGSTAGANVTISWTSGSVQAGDIAYIFGGFGTAGANNPGIQTAGYTNIYADNATATRRFGVWRKTLTAGEAGPTCLGSGTAGDGVVYGAIIVAGAAGGEDVAVVAANGSSTNPNPPAIIPNRNADCILIAACSAVSDTSKGTVTNYTLGDGNANATRPYSCGYGSRILTTGAGASEDPAAWSAWSTGAWRAVTIAVVSSGASQPTNLTVGSPVIGTPLMGPNVYYVANSGSDSNNGLSSGAPWQTLNKVNNTAFNPGDVILFNRGDTWAETAGLVPSSDGTAGHLVGYSAYGTGAKPIIDSVNITGTRYCVYIVKAYVAIDNLELKNATGTLGAVVLTGSGASHHVTVSNCDIHDSNAGLLVFTDAGANNQFLSNKLYNNVWGFHAYINSACTAGNENIVSQNEVYGNTASPILIRANYHIVQYNYVHNNHSAEESIGIHCFTGFTGDTDNDGVGNHNIIRYNYVVDQTGTTFDGGGIGLDRFCDQCEIYGNIVTGCRSYGISVYDDADAKVYNNTTYGNVVDTALDANAIGEFHVVATASGSVTNLIVANNIFVATRSAVRAINLDSNTNANTNVTSRNNIFYNTASATWYQLAGVDGSSISTWNANTFADNDQNANPLLADVANGKFWPSGASPAYASGLVTYIATAVLAQSSTIPTFVALNLDSRLDVGAYLTGMVGTNIAVGAPVIGAGTFKQAHAFTTSLTISSPVIGTGTFAQKHVLAPTGFAVGSPVIGAGTLTQNSVAVALKIGDMRPSRLSTAVSLICADNFGSWVDTPGTGYVEGYVFVPSDAADDLVISIDAEWYDGTSNPAYYSGGDWMAFVGIQPTGAVIVAVGTAATEAGTPSTDRTWQNLSLSAALTKGGWYRIRVTANYATRHFVSLQVEGTGLNDNIDLSAYRLDYPNYMPFDKRAFGAFLGAMRVRDFVSNPGGNTQLLWDDVTAKMGTTTLLTAGFEGITTIGAQPLSGPPIVTANYGYGTWYQERSEALVAGGNVGALARTGSYVLFVDATIAELLVGSPVIGAPALVKTLTATGFAVGAPVIGSPTLVKVLSATSLAVGAPVIGQGALVKVLSATSLAVGSPVIGAPVMGGAAIDLTASSVTVGAAYLSTVPDFGLSGATSLHAVNLTVSSPVIGVGTITQKHVLVAVNVDDSAPTFSSVTLGPTPVGINVGSPVIGTPAPGFNLTAPSVTDSSPVIGAAQGGYNLTATNLTTSSPVIGAAKGGYNITATSLAVSAPVIGAGVLAQTHVLTATSLTVSSPVIGTSSMTGATSLTAVDLVVGSPVISSGTIAQAHVLAAVSFADTSPVFGTPALGKVLSALGIDVGSLVIGAPALGKVLAATNLIVSSPVIGASTIGQVLSAVTLADSSPVIGTGVLAQKHVLSATSFDDSSPEIGMSSMTGAVGLTAVALVVSSPVLGSRPITQTHVLTPIGFATASPVVNASNVVSTVPVALVVSSPVIGEGSLAQKHILTPVGFTTTAPVIDAGQLGQTGVMAAISIAVTAPSIGVGSFAAISHLTASSLAVTAPSIGVGAYGRVIHAQSKVTNSPEFGTPELVAVAHPTAQSLTTSAPVIGTPAMVGVVKLTSVNVAVSAPTIGTATAHVIVRMLTADLNVDTPDIGLGSMIGGVNLTAVDVIGGTPVIGQRALNVIVNATAPTLATGSPVIGAPALVRVVHFTAPNFETANPFRGVGVLHQHQILSASNLTVTHPFFGLATIGIEGVMQAVPIETGLPFIGVGTFAQVHAFSTTFTVGAPTIGTPAFLAKANFVAPSRVQSNPEIGVGYFGRNITPASLVTSAPSIGVPTMRTMVQVSAPPFAVGTPSIGVGQIQVRVRLVPRSLEVAVPALGAPALVSHYPVPLTTGAPVLGAPSLAQTHRLSAQAVLLERPTIGRPKIAVRVVLHAQGLTVGAPDIQVPGVAGAPTAAWDGRVLIPEWVGHADELEVIVGRADEAPDWVGRASAVVEFDARNEPPLFTGRRAA